MKNHIITFALMLTFILAAPTSLLASSSKVLPIHSRVFITPMNNGLDGFIKAEVFRQKLPVTITLKDSESDFVLTGTMVSKEGSQKWFHYLTGTAGTSDSAQASLSLIKTSDESLVWSGDAGDRSIWWGMLKKKGERKVAQRLVAQLKKLIQK